jgi:hypothetical protein
VRNAIIFLLSITCLACSEENLGIPRTPLAQESPDGHFVAFVRNHLSIDPPNQSIWVGKVGGPMTRVEKLFEDMDWCSTIAWSADSSTVAFVIRRGRLRVVDAASGNSMFNDWVVEWHGEYPTNNNIEDLTLSSDGKAARFRVCHRNDGCSDFMTIDISGNQ